MVFRFRREGDAERLDRIEATLQQMIVDDLHAFELAMSALLGERSPHEIGAELRATDHGVNAAERDIRRELVVHASVQGAIDTPAILIYMSIVKDIERIGDYAKNLFDLAADGADLSTGLYTGEITTLAGKVPEFITAAAAAFADRDEERSKALMRSGDDLLDHFDERVSALVKEEHPDHQAVAVALTHRYLKRIVAHAMNVLSAVVMPVDRLDYFDEDPEDRS
jgi:phosphate transport system protein